MFFSQARQVDYKIHLEVDFTSKNNQKNPGREALEGKLSRSDIKTYCQTFVNIKCGIGAWINRQTNETEEQTCIENGLENKQKFHRKKIKWQLHEYLLTLTHNKKKICFRLRCHLSSITRQQIQTVYWFGDNPVEEAF